MKLFISWSGDYSRAIAIALKEWLGLVFPSINIFLSTDDIRKGQRWRAEIAKALEQCNFGIVCLTSDNLNAPWLLYESGALSKALAGAQLFTLLFHVKQSDIVGPLEDFQHTTFSKEDFFKLIASINEIQGQVKHSETNLKKLYERFFEDFDKAVAVAGSLVKKQPTPPKRDIDEILEKLLETTNYIARNIPTEQAVRERLLDPTQSEVAPPSQPSLYPANETVLEAVDLDPVVTQILQQKGIRTIGQLALCTPTKLHQAFGLETPAIRKIQMLLEKFGLSLSTVARRPPGIRRLKNPWEHL